MNQPAPLQPLKVRDFVVFTGETVAVGTPWLSPCGQDQSTAGAYKYNQRFPQGVILLLLA